MPGLLSDSDEEEEDHGEVLRNLMRDMPPGLQAFHPGGAAAMLPPGLLESLPAMVQSIQARLTETLAARAGRAGAGDAAAPPAAAAAGGNPFQHMHFRFAVPDEAAGLFGGGAPAPGLAEGRLDAEDADPAAAPPPRQRRRRGE